MTDHSDRVSVLGLGPMGRALAGAFLDAGHPTTVWNRTAGRDDDLLARGAVRAGSPAEAAEGGDVVVVCVLDAAAVRAVVEPAREALRGRTLVNLTADTPDRARELAALDPGLAVLNGAIMTPATTIGTPHASVLYAGPPALFEAHRATLAALGGSTTFLGPEPGTAASHEVALLDLFWTSIGGLAHAFALARAEGVPARDLAPHARGIAGLLPAIIDEFAGRIDDDRHDDGTSSVRSAAAGVAHVAEAARARGLPGGALDGVAALAADAIARGHGDDAVSSLARVRDR